MALSDVHHCCLSHEADVYAPPHARPPAHSRLDVGLLLAAGSRRRLSVGASHQAPLCTTAANIFTCSASVYRTCASTYVSGKLGKSVSATVEGPASIVPDLVAPAESSQQRAFKSCPDLSLPGRARLWQCPCRSTSTPSWSARCVAPAQPGMLCSSPDTAQARQRSGKMCSSSSGAAGRHLREGAVDLDAGFGLWQRGEHLCCCLQAAQEGGAHNAVDPVLG